MAFQNIVVSIRNDSGSPIVMGNFTVGTGATEIIWDTVDYDNSKFLNFSEITENLATFNENIQNGNLVLILDDVDLGLQPAFDQFQELWDVENNNEGAEVDYSVIKLGGNSSQGISTYIGDTLLSSSYSSVEGDILIRGANSWEISEPGTGLHVVSSSLRVNDSTFASLSGSSFQGPLSASQGFSFQTAPLSDWKRVNAGGSTILDFREGQKQTYILTASLTITSVVFPGPGNYVLFSKQDATGGRTCSISGVGFIGGVAYTPSTDANALDVISFVYDGVDTVGSFGKASS